MKKKTSVVSDIHTAAHAFISLDVDAGHAEYRLGASTLRPLALRRRDLWRALGGLLLATIVGIRAHRGRGDVRRPARREGLRGRVRWWDVRCAVRALFLWEASEVVGQKRFDAARMQGGLPLSFLLMSVNMPPLEDGASAAIRQILLVRERPTPFAAFSAFLLPKAVDHAVPSDAW